MILRAYRPADAAVLAQVFHEAVHTVGAGDYTPAQCKAWSPAPVTAQVFDTRVSDGRCVWVAEHIGGHPVAFIELESNGHIDCFYCHPSVAGQGVGAALYTHLEHHAQDAGLDKLWVEASDPARRFFLKVGFCVTARRDFVLRGVALHNYAMQKDLRPS